ncbi:MAG: Lrp/AsnC family transcriptional regulator [Candidatus Aceula lacicola]|nr:Lrp/AsnC family transcriptional regulator [Candidatus Aceula lacicola]
MNEILEILAQDARIRPEEIAKLTGQSVASVKKVIEKFEKDGVIVKYKTVINKDLVKEETSFVRALIEVSMTPKKDVGFDYIAERIYSFPEVKSCYLLSGSYDLLLEIEGNSVQMVAGFVASKLSAMPDVRGTVTHFLLKKYKEDGHVLKKRKQKQKLNISY